MAQIKDNRTAVILCNLGGPRNIDEVKGFLLDLLGDPNVIQLPWFIKWFQKTLAKIIVNKRLPYSQKLYQDIGGKSPLVEITQVQARLLEKKTGVKAFIFMNCGKPDLRDLKNEISQFNQSVKKVIVLPLFPQYSTTTTKTSIEKIQSLFGSEFSDLDVSFIRSYPQHPLFINSWIDRIKNRLKRLDSSVKLLFSAHGIPKSYVEKGDPYFDEVQSSVEQIMKAFPGYEYELCFQSRFGKAEWLKPYTDKLIEEAEPGSKFLIVPISFVSDHVETIHEIGIEFQELAENNGVEIYRVPGLNHSSIFIDCLADLVQQQLKNS